MSVGSLGYIGFEVSDRNAWSDFMTSILGAQSIDVGPDLDRYRIDVRAWRIALTTGDRDDIAFAGFEVADATALQTACARLTNLGFTVIQGDADLAYLRRVSGLAFCDDPFGLRIEIFWGALECHDNPFASPVNVSGFVTGDEGLGHIVISAPDMDKAHAFYCDGLGFRLADIIQFEVAPGRAIEMEFLYCNARHHSVALLPAAPAKRLHHFMLQAKSIDDVGFGFDRAQTNDVPIALSIGRHTNDHMISFYLRTPSGFEVEYGCGSRSIDSATWQVVRHNKMSSWGHKRLSAAATTNREKAG